MRRRCALVVFAILTMGEPPALADQNDSRLDPLFARLLETSDPREARQIEAAIWSVWIDANDEEVNPWMERGMRAMQSDDYRSALAAFESVVRAAPEFAEGWNKRATCYWLIGDHEASLADIERTLELEPRHFGALSGLALIRAAQGRAFEAIEALARVMRIHPHLPYLKERIERLSREFGQAI